MSKSGSIASAARSTLWVWDLDRTLFNTGLFVERLLAVIATLDEVRDNAGDFQQLANTELFDPLGFLEQQGVERARIEQALRRSDIGSLFLYPDVPGAIARVARISGVHQAVLTTGTEATQRFKLALSPNLASLPQAVTQHNKGAVLEAMMSDEGIHYNGRLYRRIVLVDDKASSFARLTPRPNLRCIHLQRPDAKYTELLQRPDIVGVPDLEHVPDVLAGWL